MKVKDTQEIGAPRPVAQAQGQAQAGKAAAPQAERPVATDRVTETVRAAAQAASHEASQTRATRLQEVMAAVRQGTYVPNPQQVADSILDDAEVTASLQMMLRR